MADGAEVTVGMRVGTADTTKGGMVGVMAGGVGASREMPGTCKINLYVLLDSDHCIWPDVCS